MRSNVDAFNNSELEEISREQFFVAIHNEVYKSLSQGINIRSSDTDRVSESWVKFTTKLADVRGKDEWLLTNNATYIAPINFMPAHTHVIGLGTNSNFSVVKNSEYLKHEYDVSYPEYNGDIKDQTDWYWRADQRSGSGYAFNYRIYKWQVYNKATMTLRITPNTPNVRIVDGYGHYARYTRMVKPSLSFSMGGASLSISPTLRLQQAGTTHAQLRR